jgi:hypothetical protein
MRAGVKYKNQIGLHIRPHPGPLPRGEGDAFAACLKIRAMVFAGRSAAKPETCKCCSFSPGEKVRMRAG